jgi:hypothetical protein
VKDARLSIGEPLKPKAGPSGVKVNVSFAFGDRKPSYETTYYIDALQS